MSLRHYLRRPPAISAAEAVRLVEHGALVVDVRRQFEWNRVHIPGAVHAPLEELLDRCLEFPDDRLLITFCTGGIRSAGAANLLVENGFDAVNMSGGLVHWRGAGGSLTARGEGGTLPAIPSLATLVELAPGLGGSSKGVRRPPDTWCHSLDMQWVSTGVTPCPARAEWWSALRCRRSARRHAGGIVPTRTPLGWDAKTVSERNVADVERELAMLAYVRDRLRVSEGTDLRIPTTAVDRVLDELNSLERAPRKRN